MIDIITLRLSTQDVTIVTLVTRLPHDYWLFGSMLIEFKQTLPEVVIH